MSRSVLRNPWRVGGIPLLSLFFLSLFVCPALAGCKDVEKPSILMQLLSGSHERIGVVSSDLSGSGRFGLLTLEGFPQLSYTSIHSDAVARYHDGRVYIVNRLRRDNIQILNSELLYSTEREISTGAGSNPHDIVLADRSRGYVSLYERNYLLQIDPLNAMQTGSVDLSGFADGDGIPEASGMHLEGDLLYVALQRLDRNSAVEVFPPTDYSLLLEIETKENRVLAAYRTPFANPFGSLHRTHLFGKPHLVLVTPGRIGEASLPDGGVVAFDLASRRFRIPPLYLETTAGGDLLDVALKSDSVGYALVHIPNRGTELHRFNPATGGREEVLYTLPESEGYLSRILLAPNGYLYVAESGLSHPGVLIFDTVSNRKLTPLAVQTGLRPTDLIYIP